MPVEQTITAWCAGVTQVKVLVMEGQEKEKTTRRVIGHSWLCTPPSRQSERSHLNEPTPLRRTKRRGTRVKLEINTPQ